MRTSPQILVSLVLVAAGGCTCTVENREGDDAAAIDAPRAGDAAVDAVAIDAVAHVDARATPSIPPDCLAAAARGMAWLVTQQNPDGSWGAAYKSATTGFAVLKLETYAAEIGMSPFEPTFVYADQVARGLDYLFGQAVRRPIEAQPYGNPDGNGNGSGIHFSIASEQMYENAIVLMAIVAGAEPDRVVPGGNAVSGLTYRAVVEDSVDYLAMAQSDAPALATGCAWGGWSYAPRDRSWSYEDNSVTQFVTLALAYARHPLYQYEIATPAWVMTELNRWVDCIQNESSGYDDGGSGYRAPDQYVNAYKTGALVQQFAFLGRPTTEIHVIAALTYLHRTWTDPTAGWNKAGMSDKLAMYSIMKGMESMAITDLGGIDWYREFCDELKAEQLPDGSWPASGSDGEVVNPEAPVPSGLLSTIWALLVLEHAAPPPEVIP